MAGRQPPGGHSTIAFGDETPFDERVSANRYARGHDQNSGNVLTDVPTTRVNAPPGGQSTFSLNDGSSAAHAGSFRAPVNGPVSDEPLARGQYPAGGKQSYKFGTPSPMPISVRDQATFRHNHKFGVASTPQPIDPAAPPVGGRQEVCLGDVNPSPPALKYSDPRWPNGKSPAAAGMQRHLRTRPGETTLTLSPTPQSSNDRLPPGGLQHNIFSRQSLANNPRMFPLEDTNPPPSGRVPPGGESTVSLGDDPDSMPAVQLGGAVNAGTPRALQEKHAKMQEERAPPGGRSTIQLG